MDKELEQFQADLLKSIGEMKYRRKNGHAQWPGDRGAQTLSAAQPEHNPAMETPGE